MRSNLSGGRLKRRARRGAAAAAGPSQDQRAAARQAPALEGEPSAAPTPADASPALDPAAEIHSLSRRFRAALGFTLLLAILSSVRPASSGPGGLWSGGRLAEWVQFALATPVVLWAGSLFFRRGWRALVRREPDRFTLLGAGLGAAYGAGTLALVAPGGWEAHLRLDGQLAVPFGSAAAITVLALFVLLVEAKVHRRIGREMEGLPGAAPPSAHLLRKAREERITPEEIRPGDLLRVCPGDIVPADGVVMEGRSDVDESTVTGDPAPNRKARGDRVIGGSVNGAGSLVLRAERAGAAALRSQIVRLVSEAQFSRPPVQLRADALSRWLVPAVLAAAATTFIGWLVAGPPPALACALVHAVTVLVAAAPGAFALAAPLPVRAAILRAARGGIVVNAAAALETTERVTHLVIDKTGTLTTGRPQLVDRQTAAGKDPRKLLRIAASAEQPCEHPLAAAILEAANEQHLDLLPVNDVQCVRAAGVTAVLQGKTVRLGKERFLADAGVVMPVDLIREARRWQGKAQTVVWVAVENQAAGILGFADPPRASSAAAIAALHQLGVTTVMCTGDNRKTAEALASQVGIEDIIPDATPGEKTGIVQNLQRHGAVVALAGDGTADEAALAEADAAIVMRAETAGLTGRPAIALVRGSLLTVVEAVRLSRNVMRTIRRNLAWAALYNGIAVAMASGGVYALFGWLPSPAIAAAAAALPSLAVAASALRLQRTSAPGEPAARPLGRWRAAAAPS